MEQIVERRRKNSLSSPLLLEPRNRSISDSPLKTRIVFEDLDKPKQTLKPLESVPKVPCFASSIMENTEELLEVFKTGCPESIQYNSFS